MHFHKFLLLVFAAFLAIAPAAIAGNDDPLFVNLTTDEPHRALMGLQFSKNQLARKHPVTVFLNDRGVMLGAKSMTETFKEHRVVEAERSDAGCNPSDLLGTVRPGVSAVRPKARQGVQ